MSLRRAVLFDLFGTLVPNFSADGQRTILRTMAEALDVPEDSFATLWTETFDRRATGSFPTIEANLAYVSDRLGGSGEQEGLQLAIHRRNEFYRNALTPFPGTVAVLKELKARGLGVGLVSDCSSEVLEWWETSGLAELFDTAVFSCAVGFKKPDPRIYLAACTRLQVSPEHCVYVGDGGSNELSGARGLGMTAVLVLEPRVDKAVLYSSEAASWDGPVIAAMSELLERVDTA